MKIRTGYSFRAAAGTIENVMSRLVEIKATAAPISDRASTFGHVRWEALAKKNGLRPIFGVELAVTASPHEKRPVFDYWTFFAIKDVVSIYQLLETATQQFRYEPLLTYQQAMKAKDVIKITGERCLLKEIKPSKDLFLPLGPSSSHGFIQDGMRRKFEFIATGDNKYPRAEDFPFYELVIGSRLSSSQTYPQHILDHNEWVAAIDEPSLIPKALKNAMYVERLCVATLPKGRLPTPVKKKSLRQMCFEGAQSLGCDLTNKEYLARLDRELALIKEKDFEDYFYIISDLCQWARARMFVGPARGSSCGSLVCYLLGITTIDPIPYNLIFERFIDINRSDLPDIDIDFSDQQRHLVFDYLASKYGADHVARLGTVNMFKPRSALHEAGIAFNIPRFRLEQFADTIINRSSGDSRALQTMEDTFKDGQIGRQLVRDFPEVVLASGMEGHPKHHGQHAAGVVLTSEPVRKYTAIDARTNSTHSDKKDADDLNLLKIDALGLTQLSVFEDALEFAGLDRNHLFGLATDDADAFDVLNKGHFAGIFQFNGSALQQIARSITVDHIEDIIAIGALARPGPMASGGTNTWIARRNGSAKLEYPHPLFEPHLKNTLGVVVYQEQVMTICRDIGVLSWEEVSALRKAMSKTLGKEYFDKYGDKWKQGAREKGIDEKILTKVWDDLCAYGSWAFNRSHSVAYGYISYWCCWLKAHHPVEFAAATLSHEGEPAKQLLTLRELAKEGISYVPVDIELSTDKWTVGKKGKKKHLIGPVQNIEGIGPKTVQEIMSCRARGEPLPASIQKKLSKCSSTKLDTLFPIAEAVARVLPDPSARNIHSKPVSLAEARTLEDEQVLCFVLVDKIVPRDENEAIRVAKRGGAKWTKSKGSAYLVLYMSDDSDSLMGRISAHDYEEEGAPIVERGGAGKALYAVKGVIPPGFNMMMIKYARYIGDVGVAEDKKDNVDALPKREAPAKNPAKKGRHVDARSKGRRGRGGKT